MDETTAPCTRRGKQIGNARTVTKDTSSPMVFQQRTWMEDAPEVFVEVSAQRYEGAVVLRTGTGRLLVGRGTVDGLIDMLSALRDAR